MVIHQHDNRGYHTHDGLSMTDPMVQLHHMEDHEREGPEFLAMFWGHEPTATELNAVRKGVDRAEQEEAQVRSRYLAQHSVLDKADDDHNPW